MSAHSRLVAGLLLVLSLFTLRYADETARSVLSLCALARGDEAQHLV